MQNSSYSRGCWFKTERNSFLDIVCITDKLAVLAPAVLGYSVKNYNSPKYYPSVRVFKTVVSISPFKLST